MASCATVDGEAFAARYAPTLKDLAPRDMVSRFIYQEIKEGRGIDGKDYVYLDLTHLPEDVIDEKLPDITDFARTYLGIEPKRDPIPIQPTAHYAMGGIPTDLDGRVLRDADGNTIPGLYSAGENACVSVHGANRLGTNSLVDLVVFGRRAGRHMLEFVRENDLPPLPVDPEFLARAEVADLLSRPKGERIADLRRELQVADDGQGLGRPQRGEPHRRPSRASLQTPLALRLRRHRRPRTDVQHRSHRSARAGRDARLRGGAGRRRPRPRGESRRPLPHRLPGARRRELAQAHHGAQDIRAAWN